MGGDASDQSCVCRNPTGAAAVPVEGAQVFELAAPHHRGLVGFGVVVAEDVQDPVHDQQGDLVVERAGVVGELMVGDLGADHDVAEQRRYTGDRFLVVGIIEGERQDVGRTDLAHVFLVELGDVVDGRRT